MRRFFAAHLPAQGAFRIDGDEGTHLVRVLRAQPYEDLGFARVDHHRSVRQGFPEVILGLGKTPAQIAAIAAEIEIGLKLHFPSKAKGPATLRRRSPPLARA